VRGARGGTLFGAPSPGSPVAEHRASTRLVDWVGGSVDELLARAGTATAVDDRVAVRRLHRAIASHIRPSRANDSAQPASLTWRRRRGSCSQRLAVLESAARAIGIPTCARGLWIDGAFWYARVPVLRFAVPDPVLLAWPSFYVDREWVSVSELFATIEALAAANPRGFRSDGETLFDALSNTAVDWDGRTRADPVCLRCDLSSKVVSDLGYFASRDELFAANGHTLSATARAVAAPIFGRRVVE
jgi:hypothetical protein